MKENKRISHIENFIKIPPEEKVIWALSHGYFLYNLLSPEEKRIFNTLRNGWKRYISAGRKDRKGT